MVQRQRPELHSVASTESGVTTIPAPGVLGVNVSVLYTSPSASPVYASKNMRSFVSGETCAPGGADQGTKWPCTVTTQTGYAST